MERPNFSTTCQQPIITLKGTTTTTTTNTTSLFQKSLPHLPKTLNLTPLPTPFSSYPTLAPTTSIEDVVDDSDQISVFDAENYFKEGNESKESKRISSASSTVPRLSSGSSVNGYGRSYQTRSFNATPTASSEASWNSQVGLLKNNPHDQSIAINLNGNLPPNNYHGFQNQNDAKRGVDVVSSKKWSFCLKCPCAGKKSIQVQDNKPNSSSFPQSPSPSPRANKIKMDSVLMTNTANHKGIRSEEFAYMSRDRTGFRMNNVGHKNHHDQMLDEVGFSFPVLNDRHHHHTSTQAKIVLMKNSIPDPNMDDSRRDSLEVFHPSNINLSTRKQLISSINFPPGLTTRISTLDEDMASDASSDLFEIESFSTITTSTHPLYRRRDSLEETRTYRTSLDEPTTPSIAPTECYEPSEASIDWSVTTAEGFDRASVANFSDIDMEVRKIQRRNSSIGGILNKVMA
ncbi:protein PHYTOCHROME KINASE SUBSTRATE 4-like [Impatiens glandulifera]|uniref:protein PHYTOCHROME KINASE SUBSTRATE 4-like n=1 Tax=Impatiens glandulifera TaxID=253017 RepID=UPI001FB1443D|nr:protein PHYTOCHROME KINASE SUBSTRATE 4-like [Impatiens glandulifera]